MDRKHPLIEYAARKNLSLQAIAEKAGCSRMTLYRLMAGENATVEMLQKVSAATDGDVPASAFLPAEQERVA